MSDEHEVSDMPADGSAAGERVRLLAELRASDERFRLLVEGSQDFMSY
ncbi:MAG: hypothetical protein JWP02_747, partial [Acidimicrobiales bacterium]|nr:hypothetical protein [Acidimicrobiales bacterium]